MFFDERINRETNKIFSNAILYATIISTLYLIIKSFVFGFNFSGSISEIFIIITGLIIIIKDLVNFKNSVGDERIIEERMIYYKKATTIFLAMSLLGFAIAIPFYFLQTKEAPPMNVLFIYLELLGFIYFTYQFKKNRIFFNYSFIEKETGYYKDVFKNILKLTILISIVYGIAIILSFFIFLLETWMVLLIISLIITFIISLLTLTIYYLFISWMERLSYKGLLKGYKYLKSQMVIGTLYIIITITIYYIRYKIVTFDPSNSTNAAQIISNIISSIDVLNKLGQLLLVMLLSNIYLQFKHKPKGLNLMIYSTLISIIINLFTMYIGHLVNLSTSMNFQIYSLIIIYINFGVFIFSTIGLIILTIDLIRNKMHTTRILIPFIGLLLYVVNLGFNDFNHKNKIIFSIISVIFNIIYIISIIKIKNQKEVLLNQ